MPTFPPSNARISFAAAASRLVARLVLLTTLGCLSAAGPASRPVAKEADRAKEPAGAKESLVGGQFQFYPPQGWEEAKKSRNATTAAYVAPGHEGALAIQVLPADAEMDAATAGLIVRKVKAERKKAGTKVVMDVRPEEDKHFALRLREKYMEGEKVARRPPPLPQGGAAAGHDHGQSLGQSEEDAKPVHATGEEVALSVEFTKPAGKGK